MQQATERKNVRTCIACGESERKNALHRIVRNADGLVSFDPTGKAAGRGAYVCGESCLASARKTDKLSRALRCKVSDMDYEQIANDLAQVVAASPME